MDPKADDSDFDFSCPHTVVDIASLMSTVPDASRVDPWFFEPHPQHKKLPTPEPEPALQNDEAPAPAATITTTRSTGTRSTQGKSDITKSTTSSAARRCSEDVVVKRLNSTSTTSSTKTAPAKTAPIKRTTRTQYSTPAPPVPEAPAPEPPQQKVSVQMKSFSAPTSSSRGPRSHQPSIAPSSQSRAAQLQQYRQQKKQQARPETSGMVLQKRGVSCARTSEEPRAKKQQTGVLQPGGRNRVNNTSNADSSSDGRRGSVVSSKKETQKKKKKDDKENSDMLDLLKEHNKKFRPVALYEPSRHSVRDVRRWERATGQAWGSLAPDQRERANEAILQLKLQSAA